jgi:hypothetical protein
MISTYILIIDCILQDFKPPVDVSIEDVKRVREMLCEYIPKEAIDRKGNLYSGAPWVYCDQKLETHSVFFSQVLCLRNLLDLLGLGQILPGSGLQIVFSWLHPNKPWWEYLETWCDPSSSIMWSCFAYICVVGMCSWCLLAVVTTKSWLVPGCSPWWLPNPGWFQDPAGNQAGYCSCGHRVCNGR